MKDAVLVLGAGHSNLQRLLINEVGTDAEGPTFQHNFKDVWTIDIDHTAKPKVEWDLTKFPWPVPENFFDEVHAYEVLEHLNLMGDYVGFFELWKQIWLCLKLGGLACATTPWWESVWAWQDPGHRSVYSAERLCYLDQDEYTRQIGITSMTDYRRIYPPPFSFRTRMAHMTKGGTPEGEPFDPKVAGFMFVVQKEIYGNS